MRPWSCNMSSHMCQPCSGVSQSDLHIQPFCNCCMPKSFHFSVCHLLTSSHTSSMKRQREESWNCDTWERNRKMPLTLEHWHGCPHCGARNLSWSEWASYSTILNPVEQYDLCTTCLRKIMKKHWKMMYWWRWTGSGGLQEEFVTSPCMPIN